MEIYVKKCCLALVLNNSIDWASRQSLGRLFHTETAEFAKIFAWIDGKDLTEGKWKTPNLYKNTTMQF